jgi:hypothetical protein
MWLLTLPADHPRWFFALALIWSGYQAVAGWVFGLYTFDRAHPKSSEQQRPSEAAPAAPWQRFLVYALHHSAFYFICTVFGFASWRVLSVALGRVDSWGNLSAGAGTVLIALATFVLVGVSGILPRILYLGNRLP